MVVMVAAVWLCVRVWAAGGLSAVRACVDLGVGCRALRLAPMASGGGVRVAQGVGAAGEVVWPVRVPAGCVLVGGPGGCGGVLGGVPG